MTSEGRCPGCGVRAAGGLVFLVDRDLEPGVGCGDECCAPGKAYCGLKCWADATIRAERAHAREAGRFLPWYEARALAVATHHPGRFRAFIDLVVRPPAAAPRLAGRGPRLKEEGA